MEINRETYKPNSHKYKAEQQKLEAEKKKIEKVVSGTAKVQKKTKAHKFADIFLSEDASSVKTYLLMDVIVPTVKNLIFDTIRNGAEMLIYGETRRGDSRSSRGFRSDFVSYDKYARRNDDRYAREPRNRTPYNYDDIILETRGDAEQVLTQLDDLIDTYGVVSIADLYDLVGLSCDHTYNKYGWTNIRNAEVIRVRYGYKIKLPKALPID